MGEIAINLLRWTVRISFVIAAVIAFIGVLNIAISAMQITINQSVIGDLVAMVQMWLPFNLGPILAWILSASVAYLTYRLYLAAVMWIHRFIG